MQIDFFDDHGVAHNARQDREGIDAWIKDAHAARCKNPFLPRMPLAHVFFPDDMDAFEPTCVVIIGNYSREINKSSIKKKSLGLFRSHLKDIEIITYDELFGKVQLLVNLLEGESDDYASNKEDDFEIPF